MRTAFVSASYAHRTILSAELDAIVSAAEAHGLAAHVFIRAYDFGPHQAQAMMAATLRDVRAADLLIAEVSYKAIGMGIEIGLAAAWGKPIVYVRHASAEPSTTVSGLAAATVVYRDAADLRARLGATLGALLSP